ncbi:DUF4405 domain-containing protein [Eubacteriaceae bacterium ES2]|nr:DUF4405 domain-containing protein [Eubacteriaceae bacterium ES2]
MTFMLFVVMSYQYTGGDRHEIAGTIMLILFLAHHFLNRGWYKKLFNGAYTGARILMIIVDLALLMVMLLQMISGIALSNKVFNFIELGLSVSTARNLHMICAYAGYLLMSFHIGLHYRMIINMYKKIFGFKDQNKIRNYILRGSAISIAGYGVYALLKRDFISYILMKSQYVFFDYQEPVFFFIFDYLAIMGLMIFIAYYLQNGFIILSRRKKSKDSIIS